MTSFRLTICIPVGKEVKIIRFKNDGKLAAGHIVEVRGIVNKDGTISFGEHT